MKFFLSLVCVMLLLSSCASQKYHYQLQHNPQQWKGKNISELIQRWGTADQTLHSSSGTSYYLYNTNSTSNFFNSTSTNFSLAASNADFPFRNQVGLRCSALFTTNKSGTIIATSHTGSNCGGEWAPNK
ncbi:MAG: hypothetical protein P4M12_01595 [Gammaproteobacteria bacterium]|nr:hypothetical protein [Gammaproteobacteria bacterium]